MTQAIGWIARQEAELDEIRRRGLTILGVAALAATVAASVGVSNFPKEATMAFVIGLSSFLFAAFYAMKLQGRVRGWTTGFSPSKFLVLLETMDGETARIKAARELSRGAETNMEHLKKARDDLGHSLWFGIVSAIALIGASAWTVVS